MLIHLTRQDQRSLKIEAIFARLIILLCSTLVVCLQEPESPAIFLLVGPHKTGCTTLQNYLVTYRESLEAKNLYLPPPTLFNHAKDFHHFVVDLHRMSSLTKEQYQSESSYVLIRGFLSDCLQHKRNAVLASESFSHFEYYNDPNFIVLLRELFEGFRVKVIIVYRERLARFVSLYAEYMKKGQSIHNWRRWEGFEVFLRSEWECCANVCEEMVDTYGSLVKDSTRDMIVIDYYGASNKSLPFVMLCEIMGVSCDEELPRLRWNSAGDYNLYDRAGSFEYYAKSKGYDYTGDYVTLLKMASSISWPPHSPRLSPVIDSQFSRTSVSAYENFTQSFKGTLLYPALSAHVASATKSYSNMFLNWKSVVEDMEWKAALDTMFILVNRSCVITSKEVGDAVSIEGESLRVWDACQFP
jgi:hypothetical protein